MADVREPVAWVNSARMSGIFYMYVEGESDERFWNKFVDSNTVKLQVCHGCPQLFSVVDEHIKQNVLGFIAVADRDFHAILGGTPQKDNLFFTDDHDLEMMMYHKGNAFQELTNAIDRGGKISAYMKSGHDILGEAMEISNDIGYCKLVSIKKNYNLKFVDKDGHTHEIKRPKYEDAIDSATGAYKGIERIVSKIYGFAMSCNQKPPKEQEFLNEVIAEKANIYNPWQLSNGHEVSYLLASLFHRRCKHRKKLDQDGLDSVLYAGYKLEDFYLTDLFLDMNKWAQINKIHLFK